MGSDGMSVARRLHIVEVADSLVGSEPLDKLSVGRICQAAGVPRSTFYKLFEDKLAVPVWYQRIIYHAGVGQIGLHYSWKDGCLVTTSGVELMRPLLRSASLCEGYQSTRETGTRDRAEDILRALSEVKGVRPTPRLRFMAQYCARAEIAATADWIMRDDLPDDETWSEWLAACVPSELRRLLDDPVDPWPVRPLDLGTVARLAASGEVSWDMGG